jgi:NADH dehydrogenase FAD-containing subunit
MASVRAIIPGQIKDEALFKPLESALSHYPKESWELVIGTATGADFEGKAVQVTLADKSTRSFSYDQLVLATGARSAAPHTPWKDLGSYDETLESLHDTAARVEGAQHIVVAGAGSTGVEVAGELGYEYGKTKKIILLCSGEKILGGDSVASAATSELKKLNVVIKYGARVDDITTTPDGKTAVVLANGETITTDLYLPTVGLIPNTEYVPARYLSTADPNYRTVVVDEYLRVKDAPGVWACGDMVSKPRAGFMITQKQAASVAKNVEAALAGKEPLVAKGLPVDIYACSVGRGRGAGRMGPIPLLSIMVWLAKGRNLGLPRAQGYVDGGVA